MHVAGVVHLTLSTSPQKTRKLDPALKAVQERGRMLFVSAILQMLFHFRIKSGDGMWHIECEVFTHSVCLVGTPKVAVVK